MRKTIIFGALAALVGLAAVAQAKDRPQSGMRDGTQVTREAAKDSHDGKADRDARNERSHERDDESGEKRDETREGHDEAAEHADRR